MLVAAPERWDEACFAVPALRALMASGMKVGVLCRSGQREFWETLAGLEVIECPRKVRDLLPVISGRWQAALLWEAGRVLAESMIAITGRRASAAYKEPAIQGLFMRMLHPMV